MTGGAHLHPVESCSPIESRKGLKTTFQNVLSFTLTCTSVQLIVRGGANTAAVDLLAARPKSGGIRRTLERKIYEVTNFQDSICWRLRV